MNDDLVKQARADFRDGWEFDRANREAGREDLKCLAGDQWPEEERQKREEEGRPCLTIDRLTQQVRQVTGDLRQNRPAVKVRPVDSSGDPEIAKVYSGLIRNIEARSRAKRPYITAGIQAASCGIGHFRVITDYAHAETFEQDIWLEPIHDPFSVVWDPMSRDVTRADAGYCFVTARMKLAEFKRAYPKAKVVDFDEDDSETDLRGWFDKETVRVSEYWVKEPVERELALMQDGSVIDLGKIEDEGERALARAMSRDTRKIESHVVKMWKISGVEVLEGPVEWLTPDIPIIAVTGEEIVLDDAVTRKSVIRGALDPQRMYNYWNTANAEFVALQPKQPYIAEIDQIAPFAKDWKNANRDNKPVLTYKNVPGVAMPQRQTPALASQGMISAMQIAADDIKASTGVYDAALGNKSNETSGKAILARQQESDVSTFFISDHLAAAVQQAGRIMVDLIPRIYDTERVVRIVNEDDSEEFVTINQPNIEQDGPELTNDLSVGKYDVDVSTGPSFNTRRVEAAESLIQFAQVAPEARPYVLDLIAKNMDWPGAEEIADRLRKALPPGFAESDEDEMTPEAMQRAEMAQAAQALEQQKAQLELQKLQMEVAKMQAEVAETGADTDKTRAETASEVFELAVKSGQMEQMVRAAVAGQLPALMAQQSVAPAPGSGAFSSG